MHYNDLNAFLTSGNAVLKKGPVALIFAEDEAEIASTVRHHAGLGFKAMVLFMPANFALDPEIAALVIRIDFDRARGDAFHDAVNAMIEATTTKAMRMMAVSRPVIPRCPHLGPSGKLCKAPRFYRTRRQRDGYRQADSYPHRRVRSRS